MHHRKALVAAALLGLALVPANALASAPAGVWVKVQKVVYEPNATSPTRVQVHGALMLFDGKEDASRPYARYTSPAWGYMYYECPAAQAETCRQEWTDLEANIEKADNVCAGFGVDTLPTGTLRQPGSTVEKPDTYPIQIGVSAGFSPCQAIAQFLSSNQGGAGGTGGATSSGGTGISTGGAGGKGPSAGGAGSSTGGTSETGSGAKSGGAGTGVGSGGEAASGSDGSTGSDKAGAPVAGRAASGSGTRGPDQAAKDEPAESKSFGCSVVGATRAASLLGLGVLSLVGLTLALRHRSRK
jgi:hypothetical protein